LKIKKNKFNIMKIKNSICLYPFVLLGFALILTSSCKKDDLTPADELPVLTTSNVSNITQTTATCGGDITDDGGTTVTARGVCWSTGTTPTVSDSKTIDGAGAGSFTSAITGLSPNTIYYMRAYATNSSGTGYGSAMSFTTQQGGVGLPVLTTDSVSSITNNSAISGGTIIDDGGSSISNRGVCWSTSQNPTSNDFNTIDGFGTGTFTSNMTGLLMNTTYYVRAYAMNSTGIGYGPQVSFSTPSAIFFSLDIQPIFNANCTSNGCHDGDIDPDLTPANAWNALFAGNYVDTISPALSILYLRMNSNTSPMPPSGQLSSNEIAKVLIWIEQGGQNN